MMNDTFFRSGGVPVTMRRIAEALTDYDFCVAACKYDGRPEDLTWIPEGRFERFDLTSTNNPIHVFKELRRLKKWLQTQHCDLIHCHHRKLSVLARLTGLPVLYTGHLAFDYVSWFRWLHPAHMTAVSNSVAANLHETTGGTTMACIGNPFPFPMDSPKIDLSAVRTRAVCVARLETIKGHKYLLAAWKILVDRGFQYELDLVGEGSLKPELEAQIARDGLEKLVHFYGFTKDVSVNFERCLFAILTSSVEGQPLVTLEAAAMGRASLLTAVPGSIDVIPPEHRLKNGIAFGDEMALADALKEWFTHPEDVLEEGRRFFDFLKAACDPKLIAGEYQTVYQKILAGTA